jgi:hypothetical protein
MAHPLVDLQVILNTKPVVAGIVAEIMKDNTAKITTSKGQMVVPYDVPINLGDNVTMVGGRVVSNLTTQGGGDTYYV